MVFCPASYDSCIIVLLHVQSCPRSFVRLLCPCPYAI